MGRGNDKESEFKETNNLDRKNFEEKRLLIKSFRMRYCKSNTNMKLHAMLEVIIIHHRLCVHLILQVINRTNQE